MNEYERIRTDMKTLTLKQLKEMKPKTIFKHQAGSNGERTFMWVAVRGGIHDWAIYTTLNATPMVDFWPATKEGIHKYGQKLQDKKMIRELVLCDDEAFAMYRH